MENYVKDVVKVILSLRGKELNFLDIASEVKKRGIKVNNSKLRSILYALESIRAITITKIFSGHLNLENQSFVPEVYIIHPEKAVEVFNKTLERALKSEFGEESFLLRCYECGHINVVNEMPIQCPVCDSYNISFERVSVKDIIEKVRKTFNSEDDIIITMLTLGRKDLVENVLRRVLNDRKGSEG